MAKRLFGLAEQPLYSFEANYVESTMRSIKQISEMQNCKIDVEGRLTAPYSPHSPKNEIDLTLARLRKKQNTVLLPEYGDDDDLSNPKKTLATLHDHTYMQSRRTLRKRQLQHTQLIRHVI